MRRRYGTVALLVLMPRPPLAQLRVGGIGGGIRNRDESTASKHHS